MKIHYPKILWRMLSIMFGAFFVWVLASNDSNLLITSVTFVLFVLTTIKDLGGER